MKHLTKTLSMLLSVAVFAVPAHTGAVDIDLRLAGKSANEKANIKADDVAKIGSLPKVRRSAYYIQIVDIKKIERGVAVYVRAWDENNRQVGFGKDGSVDIERFNIYNPPVLVPDIMGSVVRTPTDHNGVVRIHRYREDAREAVLQIIEHNLSVMKNIHGDEKVVSGKRGNTTSTFYPNPDPETTSVDGRISRSGVNETWATITAADGTEADALAGLIVAYKANTTTDRWEALRRGFALFDTSSLGDSDTINSATLSLFGSSKLNESSSAPSANVYSSNPLSNTNLETGDFDTVGSTAFSDTAIAYASFNTAAYNDYTLNASGISAVSKTGVSKFSWRTVSDATASTPTWSSSVEDNMNAHGADSAGTTNDPKLVVETPSVATGATSMLMSFGI